MADVGSALTGKYVGEFDLDNPSDAQWIDDWSEIVPLRGQKPEDFMRARSPDEEGGTVKSGAMKDHMIIRKKTKPNSAENVPMS